MIATAAAQAAPATHDLKSRVASRGPSAAVLADVYREEVNIAVWQRELPAALKQEVAQILNSGRKLEASVTVSPDSARRQIDAALGSICAPELGSDIAELVEMFCCLFDLKRTGLRLTILDRSMCPKFHVDRVPCRLVLTYQGAATEWLPHHSVDRSRLGRGSAGRSDRDSGLFKSERDIEQLCCGDVALFKGELWEGNENAGLVHRSPAVPGGDARLLLTLDFSS